MIAPLAVEMQESCHDSLTNANWGDGQLRNLLLEPKRNIDVLRLTVGPSSLHKATPGVGTRLDFGDVQIQERAPSDLKGQDRVLADRMEVDALAEKEAERSA